MGISEKTIDDLPAGSVKIIFFGFVFQ